MNGIVEVRRLMPEHWAVFRDVRLTMLQTDPRAFGSTHAEWAAKPEAEVRDWIARMHLFGAMQGGRCLATAVWHGQPGQITAHRGHVIGVYVRPEARRSGLFRQVMAAVEDDARAHGIRQLELDVALGNAAAESAYAALGYEQTGTIPRGLCHDGKFIDQVVMIKFLDRA